MIHVHTLYYLVHILMLSGLWFFSIKSILSRFLNILSAEQWYGRTLLLLVFVFSLVRCPYNYDIMLYSIVLVLFILPLYISLVFSRLFIRFSLFISGFIPVGRPILISPFVCIVELISYIVRPFVLLFRPFVKVSAGVYGGVALRKLCFSSREYIFFSLFFLFIYEIFVALMHWFIVQEILKFSLSH